MYQICVQPEEECVLLAGAGLVILILGLSFLGLGYLVKVKQMAELIAGYEPKKVRDKQGLTDWVGGHLMLLGCGTVVLGLVSLALADVPGLVIWAYILAVLLLVVRMAVGARRF